MATCTITRQAGITFIAVLGRIDSMSSPDIQHQLSELIMGGSRFIAVNLEEVNFLSSAGLRIFLIAQKELNNVGGEIILFKANEGVMRVFKMTGFDKILKILSTEEELAAICRESAAAAELEANIIDGITFKLKEMADAETGTLRIIGSQDKFASADYDLADVVTIPQASLRFGTGLATIGDEYDEYKHLFGETLIINNHIFFYPAVKRPAVDYMFYSGQDAGTDCRFLNGFSFNGGFRCQAAFETANDSITLDRLLQWVLTLPFTTPLLGIVMLAESKGIYGMNLKQIPIKENKPVQDLEIYDIAHVASWINFPVDPGDHNHIIAAAGLVCRDKEACAAGTRKLFSDKSVAHIHAGIFAQGPVSKNIDLFPGELDRILTELDITKVQHLLGGSRFSNGMLGIIELKG
jgi:anti-anti-sigma factor